MSKMNPIIKIINSNLNSETVQTVNARELHQFLEVKTAFDKWIARRIEEYGFDDGMDFSSFLEKSSGGRPSKEYALSLDMAKELSMVERNDKGKQARQYFIDCEKTVKSGSIGLADNLENPAWLRSALLDYSDKVIALQAQVDEQAPLAKSYKRFAIGSDGSLCVTDAAKSLNKRPKDMFAWLRAHKWIYRRAGCASYIAYQDRIQKGFLEHKVTEVTRSDGSAKITEQVRVTAKGIAKLGELFEKEEGALMPPPSSGRASHPAI